MDHFNKIIQSKKKLDLTRSRKLSESHNSKSERAQSMIYEANIEQKQKVRRTIERLQFKEKNASQFNESAYIETMMKKEYNALKRTDIQENINKLREAELKRKEQILDKIKNNVENSRKEEEKREQKSLEALRITNMTQKAELNVMNKNAMYQIVKSKYIKSLSPHLKSSPFGTSPSKTSYL